MAQQPQSPFPVCAGQLPLEPDQLQLSGVGVHQQQATQGTRGDTERGLATGGDHHDTRMSTQMLQDFQVEAWVLTDNREGHRQMGGLLQPAHSLAFRQVSARNSWTKAE